MTMRKTVKDIIEDYDRTANSEFMPDAFGVHGNNKYISWCIYSKNDANDFQWNFWNFLVKQGEYDHDRYLMSCISGELFCDKIINLRGTARKYYGIVRYGYAMYPGIEVGGTLNNTVMMYDLSPVSYEKSIVENINDRNFEK